MRKQGRDHLGEQLLAYLDGELDVDEANAVEAHLAGCSQCAAELAALRGLGQGLGHTVDAVMAPVKLSREADDRIRAVLRGRVERRERAGWFWQLWGRRMQVAQGVLAMVLVVFSVTTFRTLGMPAPAAAQEVLVLGETRLAPGSQGALRVVVRTTEGSPSASTGSKPALAAAVPQVRTVGLAVAGLGSTGAPVAGAKVVIGLLTASGVHVPLYEGSTDAFGTVNAGFAVPEIDEGTATLVIETKSDAGSERLEQGVTIARGYRVYLMADKPAYRPGQTIRMRALVLDATTLLPVDGEDLVWRVTGPDGKTACRDTDRLSEYGVSSAECDLSTELDEGTYTLSATLGDTITERSVAVADYELPAFKVGVSTDRSYYTSDDTLLATVDAVTFFGMPVAGGEVVVRLSEPANEERPLTEARGTTDSQGRAEFKLALPSSLAPGQLAMAVEVVDATGRRAGLRQTVVVASEPLRVRAMPESGVLKPGVENDVYLMVTTPDGRPAAVDLEVRVDGELYDLSTGGYGLAVLSFTPSGSSVLDVMAQEMGGETRIRIDLPAETARDTLLLHTGAAVYEAGETLVATALVSGDGLDVVYLDVVRAGQLAATLSAPVADGAATFALDLDPALVGKLELRATTLTAEGAGPGDTRLVVVDPPSAVQVGIMADRDTYAPGDVAQIEISTTDGEDGEPVPTVLGLTAVDASVLALDTLPAEFARAYLLAGERAMARHGDAPGLDLPSLLAGVDEAEQAQDLAAQAAWAGAPIADASLWATGEVMPVDEAAAARQRLSRWLYGAMVMLPVVAGLSVLQYLRRSGLVAAVVKRSALALFVLPVISPALVIGLVVGWLLPELGSVLFYSALAVAVVLVGVLAVHGWQRHRAHARRFAVLVLSYLMISGQALALAATGADPGGGTVALIVAAFLLLVVAAITEGQTLLLELAPGAGWSTTALALVLTVLAVTAPAVPALRSELAAAVGSPSLHAGPLGWLSGCAMALPEATEEPAAAEPELTAEVEAEATAMPLPQPTASPAPTATVAGEPVLPAEPYPLRQIFPETLFWDPDARTDAQGRLALDLQLADSVTTWQVSALASTRDGAIGAGSLQLVVSQDLVLDVDVPAEATAGELVTLTLNVYNTMATVETVSWQLPDDVGFETVRVPDAIRVQGTSGASATWVIRPERVGTLALEVGAIGGASGDRVLVEVEVEQ